MPWEQKSHFCSFIFRTDPCFWLSPVSCLSFHPGGSMLCTIYFGRVALCLLFFHICIQFFFISLTVVSLLVLRGSCNAGVFQELIVTPDGLGTVEMFTFVSGILNQALTMPLFWLGCSGLFCLMSLAWFFSSFVFAGSSLVKDGFSGGLRAS